MHVWCAYIAAIMDIKQKIFNRYCYLREVEHAILCNNNNKPLTRTFFSYSSLLFSGKFVCKHISLLSLSLAHFLCCAMWVHMCMWVCNIFLCSIKTFACMLLKNTQLWLDFCFYSLSIACHFRYISLLDNSDVSLLTWVLFFDSCYFKLSKSH